MQNGQPVVVVLHSPREKCWGILDEIGAAGVFLRGLDLNSFDDWTRSIAHGEELAGLTDLFFPMWRVERVTRDESSSGIPSFAELFETRTRRNISDLQSAELSISG